MEDFDPQSSQQDRRMLFEVTGMRVDLDDFRDDTSSEDDAAEDEDEGEREEGDEGFLDI
eukprot:CAMPEP_0185574326 /NCGR_PEP_ID=MMETSP0434-20130131/5822_1 /TAXON_ID=626734 ORGANISM="Favella taraikaensis, Strain Fe Narragansett Bay" /NCGR_SAMPLE_ID=MMETSP0434 /ASSEMBLY_ACC=CAM_ASM_000379 /LENGTH=58 /DNA_ID=CAMNT_0028190861 /DNA_START=498 /DNA_END=674 /DNA_ORIENTATION=+